MLCLGSAPETFVKLQAKGNVQGAHARGTGKHLKLRVCPLGFNAVGLDI